MKRLAIIVLAIAACDEAPEQRLSVIDRERVLAVVAEPAEAKPGAEVTYTALVVAPQGQLVVMPRWSYCTTPKPPTEDNAVSTSCVAGDQLIELGSSTIATASLPADGCIRYGPDTPPGNFRPRDPDPTGGFYQPIRVDVIDPSTPRLLAFGMSRITCKLGNAPAEVARDYDLRYVANENPSLDPVALPGVRSNTAVTLSASWRAQHVETYLYYDQLSQTLVVRREAMRVSWFTTGGSIDVDASAVGEDEFATTVTTTWHTPRAGPVSLWLVLRDSRGGIATQLVRVDVE